LHLHLDLGRLLRPADLSERDAAIYGDAGAAHLHRLHRHERLWRPVRHERAQPRADLPVLPVLPAPADRRHRHDGDETVRTDAQSHSRPTLPLEGREGEGVVWWVTDGPPPPAPPLKGEG